MMQSVSSETLNKYYQVGWERRWLSWLNQEGLPGNAGYKLRLRRTRDLIARTPHDRFRLLDAGCRVGIYTVQCARRFPYATGLGLDLSASQMGAATALAKQFHVNDRLRFETCDLTTTALESYEQHAWDVVLVTEVLEHLTDPLPVLRRIRNLVAPGGQVLVSVPQYTPDTPDDTDHGWVYHRVLSGGTNFDAVESMDPAALPNGEIYTYYHRHYRYEEMLKLLQQAGLEPSRFRTVFWQKPKVHTGVLWSGLDYLVQRTAWKWLDAAMLRMTGPEWGHNLLWDCRVAESSR